MLREITLKLIAGQEEQIAIKGNYLRAKTAPHDLMVRDTTKNEGYTIILSEGDNANYQYDFERIGIKNIGQGDAIFTIVIGKDASVNSSKVGGSVQVVNGEINRVKGGQCFIGTANINQVAGENSHAQLWNPANSGKNVILSKMTFFSNVQTAIGLMIGQLPLSNLSNLNGINKRLGGQAAVAQLRAQNSPAPAIQTQFANLAYPNSLEFVEFPFSEPILIPQGWGIATFSLAQNNSNTVTFQWYEESI